MPLAVRLGFSDHTISQMAETEYDRNILQTTWHYVQVTNDAVSNGASFAAPTASGLTDISAAPSSLSVLDASQSVAQPTSVSAVTTHTPPPAHSYSL